eukprot:gb/GECG01000718.1/.p1 GENE.gb/GECG01000718.1/~~gb/GECG01000718.1/.p1  ORF type:complete len:491 (+),score=34.04 gb/GECG01000718.1/:1-1473(+)
MESKNGLRRESSINAFDEDNAGFWSTQKLEVEEEDFGQHSQYASRRVPKTPHNEMSSQKTKKYLPDDARSCGKLFAQGFIVVAIGCSWAASTQLLQTSEESERFPGDKDLDEAPATIIAWFVTSWNILLLIPTCILSSMFYFERTNHNESTYTSLGYTADETSFASVNDGGSSSTLSERMLAVLQGSWINSSTDRQNSSSKERSPLLFQRSAGIRTTCACCQCAVLGQFEEQTWFWEVSPWVRWILVIVPFYVLWFTTYVLYTTALRSTSATVASSMFATSPLWVYFFSMLLIKSRIPHPVMFLVSVIVTLAGVVGVLSPWEVDSEKYEWKPILLSLGAACSVALYKTLSKFALGRANVLQVSWFLTALGLVNSVIGVGLSVGAAELDIEKDYSYGKLPWLIMSLSAVFALLTNFLINFGIAYVHPIFISLGTALGIPINALIDLVLNDVSFTKWRIAGCSLVFVGFLLSLVAQYSGRTRKQPIAQPTAY